MVIIINSDTGSYNDNVTLSRSRDFTNDKLDVCIRNLQPTDGFKTCEEIGFHEGPCTQYLIKDMILNWGITAKMSVLRIFNILSLIYEWAGMSPYVWSRKWYSILHGY